MLTDNLRKLRLLRLSSLAYRYETQNENPEIHALSFDERFSLLLDYELTERRNKRINRILKSSGLKVRPLIDSIDFSPERELNRTRVMNLFEGAYLTYGQNIIICGATGTGKTYLASALGVRAAQYQKRVMYVRLPRLLTDLNLSRLDGSYHRLMVRIKNTDLLIIDDFGFSKLSADETKDFLELIEDRNRVKSCMILSQIPLGEWYGVFFDPTVADAIMDRLTTNSHTIELRGPSKRSKIV
jgi:DNA replication protein DnaC